MNICALGIEPEREREDRLKVARALYNALVAKHPDRLITLCDDHGQALARSDRPETVPSRTLRLVIAPVALSRRAIWLPSLDGLRRKPSNPALSARSWVVQPRAAPTQPLALRQAEIQ